MAYQNRRPDTEAAAMAALWEVAQKYHDLSPEGFKAMAWVRIRGAIRDENRQNNMLPRKTQKCFGSGMMLIYYHDSANGSRVDELLRAHATVPTVAEDIDAHRLSARLSELVELLPPRERFIVSATLRGRAHKQIAADAGISQPRASQILKRAVGRLRGMLTGMDAPANPPSPADTPHTNSQHPTAPQSPLSPPSKPEAAAPARR